MNSAVLFIHKEDGFLGASPDGIAIFPSGEKALLEVKCPLTAKGDKKNDEKKKMKKEVFQLKVWSDINELELLRISNGLFHPQRLAHYAKV